MIKRVAILISLICAVFTLHASNKFEVGGETYNVDTLYYAKIGPGTTQTSLLFNGPSYNLRVFYLTIDITNPNVSIHGVCAKDMLAGNVTVSDMAKIKSKPGKVYFAGINGDFYTVSSATSNATNGTSMIGSPLGGCIVDNEIYKTSEHSQQFAIDATGVPFVGRASFSTGTIVSGDKQVLFKGVNVPSPDNGITILTYRYYGSSNQTNRAGSCAEVTAELVDGETFEAGKTCRMVVTSVPNSSGDTVIPGNGYVIHGRGTSTSGGNTGALAFVQGLKPGDIITVNSVMTIDGTQIVPAQLISGNPRTIGNGETLDTEGERGDASAYHPRTGIGYGDNKSKLIMMVVDGRSGISNGVRTSQLGDIMRYAGATDAINLDGGGSSTLYTLPLGIRNVPSGGPERAVGSAIYAVSNAPEDNEIAEIRFVDFVKELPQYGTYAPKFYGYNKYGILIDTDVKGVNLSCPESLGRIENNIFIGYGSGTHALTATYKGLTASIPVTIKESQGLSLRLQSVVNDTYNKYIVEVESMVNDIKMPISASALTWSSEDNSIATVNAQTGEVIGVSNGETVINGSLNDFTGSLKVIVERPESRVAAIDPYPDIESWKVTQTGGTKLSLAPLESGIVIFYTGASGRGPYLRLTKKIKLRSLPDTIRLRINPGDAPITGVTISTMPNANGIVNTEVSIPEPNKVNVIDLPTDKWCNADDMSNYPIYLNYIHFDMGNASTGKEYKIEILGMEAVYASAALGGISDNIISDCGIKIVPNTLRSGEKAEISLPDDNYATVSVYNSMGQKIRQEHLIPENSRIQFSTTEISRGMYIVTVIQSGVSYSAKMIIE